MSEQLFSYVRDIEQAIKCGTFYAALALALTVPDICGSIEYPGEAKINRRYRRWFDEWCGFHQSQMTAADCWALRCSYLHQGAEAFEGDAAEFANLQRIFFTTGMVGGGWSARYIATPVEGEKGAIEIPVETFCVDMGRTALGWYHKRKDDPCIVAALQTLLVIRRAS